MDPRRILIDSDRALTASPGDTAKHGSKLAGLRERAFLFAPHLRRLREEGITSSIIARRNLAAPCVSDDLIHEGSLCNGLHSDLMRWYHDEATLVINVTCVVDNMAHSTGDREFVKNTADQIKHSSMLMPSS